jgi:hypothetical protein
MTRVPATTIDPLLQAKLKGSDFRRASSLAEANSDFYKTLLATAPRHHLGDIGAGLSLEHLTPLEAPAESFSNQDHDSDDERDERTTNASGHETHRSALEPNNNDDVSAEGPASVALVGRFPEESLGSAAKTLPFVEPASRIIRRENLDRLSGDDRPAVGTPKPLEARTAEDLTKEWAWLGQSDNPANIWVPNVRPPVVETADQIVPEQNAVAIPLEPAVRSEGFPTAEKAATRSGKPSVLDSNRGVVIPETSVGQISLEDLVVDPSVAEDAVVELVSKLQPSTADAQVDLPIRKAQDSSVESKVDSVVQARLQASSLDSAQATSLDEILPNTESVPSDVELDETVEISFKGDAPVVQKNERAASRGNKRAAVRDERSDIGIGNRPGVQEPLTASYGRPDRPSNHKFLGETTNFSLDEIPVLPSAQRVVAQSSFATATNGLPTTSLTSDIALELPGQLDGSVSSTSQNASSSATALVPATAVGSVSSTGVISTEPTSAVEDQVTGANRTPVPGRVLNQVAQALKQVPAGDSTMRLQLNPVELGQLMIEISFRDGVMHGKLRAEQGQTVRMLQDGLEGLRTRLSEQGIMVQSLEVELGQQGDFTQQHQHRSFSQGQEFGQQRQSNGYFSGEGSPIRKSPSVSDAEARPTNQSVDGRWAVNVIV